MRNKIKTAVSDIIGPVPYRLQLAGGWIDQPFVSRHNPAPPGSMVVVGIEPTFHLMDRAGMATGTREIAKQLWKGGLPRRNPHILVRELYAAENNGQKDPSGSQDMVGLIFPGVNRLDYDHAVEGGVFPSHMESLNHARTARWLEKVIHLLPVAQRPEGYSPLGKKNLDPKWIARLGQAGKDCFEAIRTHDVAALGASLNECMLSWAAILPGTIHHPAIKTDLVGLLRAYQAQHAGAMFSGCGGGYLLVASERPVPGSFQVKVRTGKI